MDTSAGLTPFKKQKGDKNRKENGSASAKKDKPKDNKVIKRMLDIGTKLLSIFFYTVVGGYSDTLGDR